MDRGAVDDIIERLWTDDNQLTEHDIRALCASATALFLNEPSLLYLEAPFTLCGDIHGQYSDLLRIFKYGGCPPTSDYLFLGNYVNGGEQSVETVCLLLAYKIRYPNNIFLLRGNHETANLNRDRGFYDECKSKFSKRIWEAFNYCFDTLPVAALIDEKIFCVHAGISPYLEDLAQIENIRRPTVVPEAGLLCDLLWSDPSEDVQGWAMNTSRGCSYTFGQDIVSQFLRKHHLDLICRAHQVVGDGYEFFGDHKQLVTIYSAPNYCGEGNAGAVMSADEDLLCSFHVMKPHEEDGTNSNISVTVTNKTGKPVAGFKPLQTSNNKVLKRVENSPPPPGKFVIASSSEGYGSTSRRKSEDVHVKPSFKSFSAKEIQDATDNFSKSLMIGQGGYGRVYKCQLDNWDVAVKILDNQGDQGLNEYIKEMEVLEAMRHENLIHLLGTCFKFRALVYEYLPNGSLEDCLNDRPGKLTWEIRTRIVYQICTALRFLHAKKPEPLVHGDLKPHNVLLDANFKVKLADFGLCRFLTQGENSKAYRQTMHVSGSAGYMDPDYLGSGKVTPGVDVYSLGKTVVRILTGKFPPDIFSEVHRAKRRGSFMSIVDPTVRDWPEDVVETLAHFALKSTKPDRNSSAFMGNFYSELQLIIDAINK